MIANSFSQSSLLFYFLRPSQVYSSFFLSKLFNSLGNISSFSYEILKKSLFYISLKKIQTGKMLLFLFVFSLILGTAISNLELTTIPLSEINRSSYRDQLFGINTILSLLILPFSFALLLQYRGKKNFNYLRIDLFLFFFVLIAELSILMSTNISTSALWLLKLMRSLFIYFVFSRLTLPQNTLRYIIGLFMLTLIVEGVLATGQFLLGGLLGIPIESLNEKSFGFYKSFFPIDDVKYFRSVGTFAHPNFLSQYIVLLFPLAIIFMLNSYSKILRLIAYVSTISGSIGLFLTFTRGGILLSMFSIPLLLLLKRYTKIDVKKILYTKRRYFLALLLLLAIVFFTYTPLSYRFSQLTLDDKSLLARLQLLQETIYIVENNPWGIGPGNFAYYFKNNDVTPFKLSERFSSPVHSAYFLLISESGIVSFFIFLLIILEIVTVFFRYVNRIAYQKRFIAVGLFASIILFFIYGLWEPITLVSRTAVIFWLELGLLMNILVFNNEKVRQSLVRR